MTELIVADRSTSNVKAPDDIGPPYLIVDQYSGDSGMNPPWATLVNRPEFYGAIIKAWEGPRFNDGGWFAHNWPAVKDAGGSRYGTSWFRGAYLFLKFNTSGADQAAAYLKAIDDAGGWDSGDIMPIVDVELGGPTNSNRQASKQQVIDCVGECAQALKSELDCRVMLYGRGAMRDLGIVDKMGCDVVWNPSYTQRMVRNGLDAFELEEIVLWQYCGDNVGYLAGYPTKVSGFNKIDISVFIKGAQSPTLDDVRQALLKSASKSLPTSSSLNGDKAKAFGLSPWSVLSSPLITDCFGTVQAVLDTNPEVKAKAAASKAPPAKSSLGVADYASKDTWDAISYGLCAPIYAARERTTKAAAPAVPAAPDPKLWGFLASALSVVGPMIYDAIKGQQFDPANVVVPEIPPGVDKGWLDSAFDLLVDHAVPAFLDYIEDEL
jgi:Glycosyl hydrolases family 25